MPVWCPNCFYYLPKGKFYQSRCPQCRKIIGDGDGLLTDPYKPKRSGTRREKESPKKFIFDQKKSEISSIPTETLGFIKRDK